jgi:hypothetical protein
MDKAMQDHLKKVHEAEAASHAAQAETCSKLADSHNAMATDLDDSNPTAAQHHRDMAECYKNAGAQHVSDGQRHLACYKAVDNMQTNEGDGKGSSELKAVLDRLDKMPVPSGVSAVPLHDNPRASLVPRPGQPTAGDRESAKAAMAALDPALRPIFDDHQARG